MSTMYTSKTIQHCIFCMQAGIEGERRVGGLSKEERKGRRVWFTRRVGGLKERIGSELVYLCGPPEPRM